MSVSLGAGEEFGVLATTEPTMARGPVPRANGESRFFFVPPRSCPAVLYRYRAGEWHVARLDHLPVSFPRLVLLPRGEFLVVSPRTPWTVDDRPTDNAHVFGPDGTHRRAFTLGDDIGEVVADEDGAIWTTHDEEGWPEADGLVRWDSDGTRRWSSGICCEMNGVNAGDESIWAHQFRTTILRVSRSTGTVFEYASPLNQVLAIAADGEHLLLVGQETAGGPGDDLFWCAIAHGTPGRPGRVRRLARARLVQPDGSPCEHPVLAGRGGRLYLRSSDGGFWRADLPGAG